jgi:hypothetical protein
MLRQLGHNYILVFDYVSARNGLVQELGFRSPHNYQTPFHELLYYPFLAGVTSTIERDRHHDPPRANRFRRGRRDVLTGVCLGVVGWNQEYEAPGEHFRTGRCVKSKSRRRELWTKEPSISTNVPPGTAGGINLCQSSG